MAGVPASAARGSHCRGGIVLRSRVRAQNPSCRREHLSVRSALGGEEAAAERVAGIDAAQRLALLLRRPLQRALPPPDPTEVPRFTALPPRPPPALVRPP